MSPVFITVRTLTSPRNRGKRRYIVRYRLGGRGFKLLHGGSFTTQKEAKTRRDLIAGELAAGRDPRHLLEALRNPPERKTFATWAAEYQASRVDVTAETRVGITSHLNRILPSFQHLQPEQITPADVQAWIVRNTDLAPASLARYTATLRLILDYARVTPNPARDSLVRLPARVHEEISPPTAEHLLAILNVIPRRWVLPLITLEQTPIRIGVCSRLTWGDVDEPGHRFRLRAEEMKSRRSQWVQVPEWLMAAISATCPPEDRTATRQVFPGVSADAAKNAMARACITAGVPHYHPHDLRHRRISLWHGQGVPAAELARRAAHSRPSMSLDVYSHVMPLDEIPASRFLEELAR